MEKEKKKMSFALVSLKGKNVPVSGVAKSKNVAASVSVRKKNGSALLVSV